MHMKIHSKANEEPKPPCEFCTVGSHESWQLQQRLKGRCDEQPYQMNYCIVCGRRLNESEVNENETDDNG